MKLDKRHVFAGAALLAAGAMAYIATRSAGPVRLTQFTEQREGPLMEHLVTLEEINATGRAYLPHRYPAKVAPGLNQLVAVGFAPMWQNPNPVAAALPAEQG